MPGTMGMGSSLRSTNQKWSEPFRSKKQQDVVCWLVIDVRNNEVSINVICKRLIPNLEQEIKYSVYIFGGLTKYIAHTRGSP